MLVHLRPIQSMTEYLIKAKKKSGPVIGLGFGKSPFFLNPLTTNKEQLNTKSDLLLVILSH